jgi:general secretion pathway protein D
LAGLVREDDRRTLTSLPGILHLPFLRALFGSTEQTIDQTDIVMIVTPHIVRGHDLTANDLKPIFIGTGQSFGATGPPPLISLDAPPPVAVAGAGNAGTASGAGNPPAPGQPVTGTPAQPAVPPAQPVNNPRAPGVVPIEAVPSNPPPPAVPVVIAAAAPSLEIKAGDQPVAVPITISGVSQMTGATLSIAYDPKVLQAVEVVQGTFLKSGGATTTFTPKIDAANGRIDVSLARPAEAGGATGEGMLVSIMFKPLVAGQSPVAVSGVVSGTGGKTIQAQMTPAMLIVK